MGTYVRKLYIQIHTYIQIRGFIPNLRLRHKNNCCAIILERTSSLLALAYGDAGRKARYLIPGHRCRDTRPAERPAAHIAAQPPQSGARQERREGWNGKAQGCRWVQTRQHNPVYIAHMHPAHPLQRCRCVCVCECECVSVCECVSICVCVIYDVEFIPSTAALQVCVRACTCVCKCECNVYFIPSTAALQICVCVCVCVYVCMLRCSIWTYSIDSSIAGVCARAHTHTNALQILDSSRGEFKHPWGSPRAVVAAVWLCSPLVVLTHVRTTHKNLIVRAENSNSAVRGALRCS